MLLSGILACTLADSDSFNPTQVSPADTSGWVGYQGNGVQIGAPAEQWLQVHLNVAEAYEQLETLNVDDPSAAKVYNSLITLLVDTDTNYRLLLMKTDGTAWLAVYTEPLDIPFDEKIDQLKQSIIDNGIQVYNETTIDLPIGQATRWETTQSPSDSQIRNRQWQYAVSVGGQIYYLVFNAQAADFDDYAPTFAAMTLIFTITG